MLAPRHLPDLETMLHDLGRPAPRALAKHLGVTENTFYRWQRGERMPRPAQLAIFWETSYGRGTIAAHAANEAALYRCLSDCLKRENAGLCTRIAYLERLGRFDTANAPIFCEAYA